MSSEVSKQEYLKRYLENEKDSDRKRKKKPKRKVYASSLKIVDEDIDLKSINFGNKAEEDDDDEKPIIAEVIDERPLEVKVKEMYQSSRWKKINDDDSSRSDSITALIENESKSNSMSLQEKSNFGRNSYSKSSQNKSKTRRHDSDSDLSPPRIQDRGRKRYDSSDASPQRNKKKNISDSNISPPRSHKQRNSKNKQDSGSDISPPRSHKQRNSKNQQDSDTDISPPRHQFVNKLNTSVRTKSKRHSSDSDISPPRHQVTNFSTSQKIHKSKKYSHDDDSSSPSHQTLSKSKSQIKKSFGRHDSDSDEPLSKNQIYLPSRLNSESRSSNGNREKHSDSDISPPRSTPELSNKDKGKMLSKTLSGLKAGLQNSKTLQKEMQELREREKRQLKTLDDEVSGRNANTIIRDRKTGLKRDLVHEQQVKNEEDKKTKEYQQKYAQWGKGIEQTLEKKDKLVDDIYEMSKPLARYQDDKDLDDRLKSIIHDDDPMSEYIKKKRQKDTPQHPVYSGPPAPPNRFGIMPGFRWDGVDRSNGFEKKYFEKINKSKAVETEAYLWSVQDM